MVGTFITVLDFFIANVAVPAIGEDLHATAAQEQLVIVGYGVAFTAGLITGGRIGDLYGHRRMFTFGMAGFLLTSAACGLAPSVEFLVSARIAQGAAAALMVPQVLALVGVIYTGVSRARAFTVYGLVIGLAGVFGQVIGGALITLDVAGLSWRTIFLINIPLCALALAFVSRTIPESHGDRDTGIDPLGALLVTAALGLLVYGLVEGSERDWPAWSIGCLAASAVLTLLALTHLRHRANTGRSRLVEPALFRARLFTLGLAATVSYFLAMGSFFFVLAQYLQLGRGLSPLESGLVFLALGGGYFASSIVSSARAGTVPTRAVALGPLNLAVGYALVGVVSAAIEGGQSVLWLTPTLLVAGIGMGMTTGPLSNLVLRAAPPEHAASASGLLNTAQEGGAAVGLAIAGIVFFPALEGEGEPLERFTHAFDITLIPLVAFCLIAAVLILTAPGRTTADR